MNTEKAILAGGCFWGMEELIRELPGVTSTVVGYTGGEIKNATYRNHGAHAEAIAIEFNPEQLSYRKLLEFFFQIHNPTTKNRQGNDIGASYRSAIFYLSEEQKATAQEVIKEINASVNGREPWLPKWCLPRIFGMPKKSTRLICKSIRVAIPVTTFGPTGNWQKGAKYRKFFDLHCYENDS
jgi:peptide-methionine (S)-S-oxide reductase